MKGVSMMDDQKLILRQQVLKLLLKNFGDKNSSRSIYECADDWCNKQMTTNGLVNYYKAYYSKAK